MAISNARPTIWSAKILRALNTLLVFGGPGVINRDYEGEVANAGDTVKILTVGDVKINEYKKGEDMAGPESLTDAALTLAINQQKSFNFEIDVIDSRQANVNLLEEASRRAAYGLRKDADSFISALWTEIDATNNKGAEIKVSEAEKVYNLLVELGVKLDETDTPEDARFAVLSPAAVGNLQKDIRFIGYGTAANRMTLEEGLNVGLQGKNGLVGRAAGFNVYQSNQTPVSEVGKPKKQICIAGHPIGWSFVDQITDIRTYEPPLRFSTAYKGLHVYGAKVVRPSSLAYAVTENA